MRKLFVVIIAFTLFISCKKDEKPDPQRDAFAAFQGKYLVCDSIKTTVNGRTTKQVLGKGKGWDVSFGVYSNLEIYSSPVVYKNYAYESPDKVYYWSQGTTYQPDRYYTIISAANNKLVLKDTEPGTGSVLTEYFTAE
jgi:hypothetical protein